MHCGFDCSQGLDQLLSTCHLHTGFAFGELNSAATVFDGYAYFSSLALKPPRLDTLGHFDLLASPRRTVFDTTVFHDQERFAVRLAELWVTNNGLHKVTGYLLYVNR